MAKTVLTGPRLLVQRTTTRGSRQCRMASRTPSVLAPESGGRGYLGEFDERWTKVSPRAIAGTSTPVLPRGARSRLSDLNVKMLQRLR